MGNPLLNEDEKKKHELQQRIADLEEKVKRLEEAERKNYFQTQLLSNVRESIVATDLQGIVHYWNDGAVALYGYSADEVIGKPITFIVESGEEQIEKQRMETVLHEGSWSGQYLQKRKDGTKFWADAVISLVTDRNGKPSGFVGIDRDISESRRSEEKLKAALNETMDRKKEVSALLKASRNIPLSGSFEIAAANIVDICKNHIGAQSVFLTFFSEETNNNKVIFLDTGKSPREVQLNLHMPMQGLIEVAFNADGVVYDNDFAHSEWIKKIPEWHIELDSILLAPIKIENQSVGLIALSNKPKGFTQNDVDIVQSFSELAAVALTFVRYQNDLKVRKNQLQVIFDNAPAIMILLDENAQVIMMNRAGLSESSRPMEENIGLRSGDVLNCVNSMNSPYGCSFGEKCKDCQFRKIIDETMTTNRNFFKVEIMLRIKKGNLISEHVVLLSTAVVISKARKQVLITVDDITERRKVEKSLIENRDQLESILSNIHGITYRCLSDEHWTMIFMSELGLELTGYPVSDFIDNNVRSYESIIHWEDTEYVRQSVVEGVQKHIPWEIEYRINHKTEGIYWVYEKGSAVYWADGSVKHLDGFIVNITERKQIQISLNHSRDRFVKIFDSHPDAIFVLDSKSPPEIIECNKAANTIFQYDDEEILGYTASMLHVNKQHHQEFQDVLFPALDEKGSLNNFKFEMKRKDGSVFPSEHIVLELRNEKNELGGWISIIRDITENEKQEARLKHFQRMESLGTLAGGIAHDFNNILFPIVGMSELLMEDFAYGTPEYENLHEIYKAGNRGSELVKQILAFSTEDKSQKIPLRIQHVLDEVVKLSRSILPSDIIIEQDIQSDCCLILADSTQIHQIIMNLITNAYHAVEETRGRISVILRETIVTGEQNIYGVLKPGRYAMLKISDTGCGIDSDIKEKIFDPYFTTKEKGKGVGLGLAVVYGIVKEHGGEIILETEPGAGTSFSIYFPVIEQTKEIDSVIEIESLQGGNERILIVDDEDSIARLEKLILERIGYQVTAFSRSLKALDTFRSRPEDFDLVITDMTMPDMTGDRLASEMLSIRPDMAIIICTGYSERINKELAGELGLKGFLLKPLVQSELTGLVRKVLDEF